MQAQEQNHKRWSYYTMALADGKISEPIFNRADKDVEASLMGLDRVLHGVRYSGFVPSYEFFDERLNARLRGIKQALPNNGFTISDFTPDWSQIIFYMDGELSSGDFLLYKDGGLSLLAAARPEIKPEAVHQVETVNIKARDGLIIPTLLTLPHSTKKEKLPAIMLPHGGPESYDKKGFDWLAQYFASQGYLVIQPQFRGSTGFGWQHQEKGRGQWGLKMQDDISDAIKDLAAKGTIDADKVCIVGASYGGYAALAGAVFTPELYQCVVAINPVADVELMLDKDKSRYGDDNEVVSYWQDVLKKDKLPAGHLASISPINYVEKVSAPVLLIHGEQDKSVSIEQSENMFDLLEDANKKVTFIKLYKGDHQLSKAANRLQALKAIETFVKTHI
jgi:dipeptidyl aminopeptidase/acylaminoacyl peptidase